MKNAWLPEEILCPDCGADIKLTEIEIIQQELPEPDDAEYSVA